MKRLTTFTVNAGLNRRNFLRLMLWAGIIGYSSKSAFASIGAISPEDRALSLYNPITKESFDGVYWRQGAYDTIRSE